MTLSQDAPAGAVTRAYARLAETGVLADDPAQRAAASVLDRIAHELGASNGGGLSGLFRRRRHAPKGAYLWGEVGRGKTLLMDLFFEAAPTPLKRRVHFHEFMDEVHAGIASFRAGAFPGEAGTGSPSGNTTKQELVAFRETMKRHKTRGRSGARDPIPAVVAPILRRARLLCLDEFHVDDITNAMLLQRLFGQLFAGGMTVVATSNVPPERLYENGLNRQLFEPFIDLLKAHVEVVRLDAAGDYRLEKLGGRPVFQFGTGPGIEAEMDALWLRITGGEAGTPATLSSLGREIAVPAQARGAARFGFAALCEAPLGARDYLRIANAYHTLMIDGVPRLDRARSDAAKRFILLVDTLYDRGVKLAASFAVPLDALGGDRDTAFAFKRCRSRLVEMQSADYLARGHGVAAGAE